MSLHLWQIQRVKSLPAKVAGALGERQNYVYKRAAAMLLIFGAAGGFLPSLFMLAKTGQVWSVNQQAPHSMVDQYLLFAYPPGGFMGSPCRRAVMVGPGPWAP